MGQYNSLILGASSDLGCGLVDQLNKRYHNSIIYAHYGTDYSELEKIKPQNGNDIRLMNADLRSDEDVSRMIGCIKQEVNCIDRLIHFPALKFRYNKLKELDRKKILDDIQIQIFSLISVIQAFLPGMLKSEIYSKIVLVCSSVVCGKPPQFTSEYTMVKYMMLGLMKSLAADYEGKKININAVSPSMINTKFNSQIDPRVIELIKESSPGKRIAEISDIIPAICFLLSEDSDYISGINLNLSNGHILE